MSDYLVIKELYHSELYHHGVKGQKWGVRQFQNPDGSLTEAGRLRYGGKTHVSQLDDKEREDMYETERAIEAQRESRNKKIMIGVGIGAAAAIALGAAFVAAKYSKNKTEINIMNEQKQAQINKNAVIAARRRETKLLKIQAGINPSARVTNIITNNGNMAVKNLGNLAQINNIVKHMMDGDDMDYLEIKELYHHGIKGQKWGVRRWQEESGTLTPEGRERYRTNVGTKEQLKKSDSYNSLTSKQRKEYLNLAAKRGAKRGAIAGMAIGAVAGIGKRAFSDYTDVTGKNAKYSWFRKDATKSKPDYLYNNGSGFVRGYLLSAAKGAIVGGVAGTIVGKISAKKLAKARIADKGMKYTEQLLDEPADRIRHSDIFDEEQSLEHHGIKGQKWGIRRYQYEDGTLTEEGRRRYNTGSYDEQSGKSHKDWEKENVYKKDGKYFYKDKNGNERLYKTNINELDDKQIKDLKSKIDTENAINKFEADVQNREYQSGLKKATQPAKDTQAVLDSSARVLDATARALPTGNGHYEKKDYSDISDQELKQRISRLQLEESYGRLSGDTKYVKSGSEKAREYLQTAGAVVAIGASAAGLALTISEIRYRRKAEKAGS